MARQSDDLGRVSLALDRGGLGGFRCRCRVFVLLGFDDARSDRGGCGLLLGRVLGASAHGTVWTFHGYIFEKVGGFNCSNLLLCFCL